MKPDPSDRKIPSLLGQVTLGKSCNFSEPHFLSCKKGIPYISKVAMRQPAMTPAKSLAQPVTASEKVSRCRGALTQPDLLSRTAHQLTRAPPSGGKSNTCLQRQPFKLSDRWGTTQRVHSCFPQMNKSLQESGMHPTSFHKDLNYI